MATDGSRGNGGAPGGKRGTDAGRSRPGGGDWKVGPRGRDNLLYEEKHGFGWRSIEISGEMLMGPAHHVIHFPSPEGWQAYPEWARHRREEIIDRIKSECRPPVYEYGGAGGAIAAPVVAAPATNDPPRYVEPAKTGRAVVMAILLMLGVAIFAGWMVKRGLDEGSTVFPAKYGSMREPILREEDPGLYWFTLTCYGVASLGSAWATFWLIRNGVRAKVEVN